MSSGKRQMLLPCCLELSLKCLKGPHVRGTCVYKSEVYLGNGMHGPTTSAPPIKCLSGSSRFFSAIPISQLLPLFLWICSKHGFFNYPHAQIA